MILMFHSVGCRNKSRLFNYIFSEPCIPTKFDDYGYIDNTSVILHSYEEIELFGYHQSSSLCIRIFHLFPLMTYKRYLRLI